ncbi:hypothetical protein [Alkaliphilus peptidifermentans]|uniref:Flagellar motility protein MotE, a chaperone for MotC folding n=1 Tax=Alkaliphilus peptidifermentans DSM 18978 TaxID=1120976 RepID=A0A1G5DIK4_9FIRM|nr:hypothetical protein [Alkaliphilus peptidifermentans]SCY14230.1 hypothetical protein SAMN03080606_00915 [Alkaliphilus peptidifermentans DSM 18978]
MSQEKSKKGALKAVAIISIAFLLVPTMTAAITYYANEGFRYKTNEVLSTLPGSLGGYFENLPTKDEQEQIKKQIAKYYITLDEDRLTDKLLIVRGEDKKLYQDLLLLLNRENSVKMSRVSDRIRLIDLGGNQLTRIFEEIQADELEKVNFLADYFTALKLSDGVMEIERSFESGELTLDMLPLLFNKFTTEEAASFLYYLNTDLQQKIRFRLTSAKKAEIDRQIEATEQRVGQLLEATMIYEKKSVDELITIIGNNEKYNIQDLSVIYSKLSLEKGGRVLSKISNNELIYELYANLNELEKLNGTDDGLSTALAASVQAYRDYDEKIIELVEIYQKMPVAELAKIAEQMLNSNQVYLRHQLTPQEQLVFTNQQLILDVMKEFKPSLTANLIQNFSTQRAIELAQKIMTR